MKYLSVILLMLQIFFDDILEEMEYNRPVYNHKDKPTFITRLKLMFNCFDKM